MHSRARHRRASLGSQRGSILIWVLVVLLVLAGIILKGVTADRALDASTEAALADGGQARAVAEAGIVDAYAWFRRQQVQPVLTFAPKLDLLADPKVNETDDPAIGLVREYEIEPSLWGRYEVRLEQAAESYTDANSNGHYDLGEAFSDANGNGKWDPAHEVQDVSGARGLPGSGTVWRLVSHGFLYRRTRTDLGLDVAPNKRLGYSRLATEIRRLTITPPAAAAICSDRGDRVTVGNRSRITGESGAGIAYANGTGSPNLQSGSEVTGSPGASAQPSYDSSIDQVFGVTLSELKSMADQSTNDAASLNSPIGDYTLNVIEGDATFNETRPLKGTGIVVILGDCTITDASNSFFNGLLWVEGDLTIRAPSFLRGVIIARGNIDVRGTGGDYAEVNYDGGIITELLSLMGQYRHSKAIYVPGDEPSLGIAGGP